MGRPKGSTNKKPIIGTEGEAISLWEPETLSKLCTRIQAEGFIASEDLKRDMGPDKYTKAIAILFRQWRLFREVRRPGKDGDVHGFEWADQRHSKAQMAKMPGELRMIVEELSQGFRGVKYGSYEEITVRCRWTNASLAALPGKDAAGADLLVFERDIAGNIMLPAYCVRAMVKKTLPMVGKEQAAAYRIGFRGVVVPAASVKLIEDKQMPVVDENRHEGKGIKRSEAIPPGTEFEISVMLPTSVISPAEWLMLLEKAGQYVHLSHARSAGFGEFEVVKGK